MLSFFTTSFAIFVKPARPVLELSGRARRSHRRTSRWSRLLQLAVGLVTVGIGIGLVLQAGLGVASWDVLNVAIAGRLGVPLGVVAIVVGLLAGTLAVVLGARPRFRAIVPLLVVSPVLEATIRTVVTPGSLTGRFSMLLAGMAVLAVGVGAYIGSENGAGPADMLFLQLAERGLPIWAAKVTVDGVVVLAGWLLGGPIGIGTVIVTAGMGPLIARTMRWFDLVDAHAAAAHRSARLAAWAHDHPDGSAVSRARGCA